MKLPYGILVILALIALACLADAVGPVKISPRDRCPVCGMFVAKFPDFAAQVVFHDGSYVVFDGAKDLFKYYLSVSKYDPQKSVAGMAAVYVTDYYDLRYIDARKATYVAGSDVYGPMGKELVPFEKESDARQFMADHQGKLIMKFGGVSLDVLRSME